MPFRIPADASLPSPLITSSGGALDQIALSDGDIEKTAIDLPPAKNVGDASWIQFDYGRPVTIRGVTLASFIAANYYDGLSPSTCNGTPKAIFRFNSSDDGRTWHDTYAKVEGGTPERTISVDDASDRYFRFCECASGAYTASASEYPRNC